MTAPGDALTRGQVVRFFRWIAGSGAVSGDSVVVKDSNGTVWWTSVADGPYFPDIFPLFTMMDGVVLDTISNGTLYVYLA